MVGTSNPHPHCQIYAGSIVYATMAREAEVRPQHHRRTGRSLLRDVIDREADGPRVVSERRALLRLRALVRAVRLRGARPAAAALRRRWSTWTTSAVPLAGLVLRDVVRRYDALWGFRMPYVLAVHQAPVGDHPALPVPPRAAPAAARAGPPEVPGRTRGRRRLHDERVRPRRRRRRSSVPPSAEEARRRLCALGDARARPGRRRSGHGHVGGRRGRRWPTPSTPSTGWPTTRSWAGSRSTGPSVRVVSEGLDEPVVVGATPALDGHRRHHRRDAWPDVRQAVGLVPRRGRAVRTVVWRISSRRP